MELTRGRRFSWVGWSLGGFILLLTIGRLLAPQLVMHAVRSSLNQLRGGYRGSVDDVDLQLMRGKVHLLGLQVLKRNGLVPVPFLRISRFTLEFVLDGWAPRMELHLHGPAVTMVDAPTEAGQQWGPEFKLEELRQKLPFELAAVRIWDGQVHFRNFHTRPRVDLRVANLDGTWDRLSGCLPPGWPTCRSELRVKAAVLGGGTLAAHGRFARDPANDLRLTAQLSKVPLVRLNPALLEYVQIDAQDGRLDADVRLKQRGKGMELVIVPKLYDVHMVGGERERVKWGREVAVGIAAGWFERNRGDKAIAYKKEAGGEGHWGIIDWNVRANTSEEPGGRADRANLDTR